MLEYLSIGVPFLFIYIESRHGFGNEFYLWYEHDVLLHDGFPVLEKRKGDALSDDYVAHDCGRPAVGKGPVFFLIYGFDNEHAWYLTSSLDMMIIPFYSFVLMELVKPGWFRWVKAFMLELPFLLLPVFYIFTHNIIWFYVLSAWGAIYGFSTFILLFFMIRRYHRQLKERFSYQENINLNWLLAILNTFFLILFLWTLSCFVINVDYDNIYMVSSLILWMLIDYFVYRHESVIEELSDIEIVPLEQNEVDVSGMAAEVQRLFEEDKIYLNPKLKLSDVALAVGTNRTYLSRYFNRQNGQTFYDYVNSYRIQYAENLLKSTNFPLPEIAIKSGFNSISTFRRVFFASFGCSPNKYRVNA